jgi:hypothetical protein
MDFAQWLRLNELADRNRWFDLEKQPREKRPGMATFDFDETLTKWEKDHRDDTWMQVPNAQNIQKFLMGHAHNGDQIYIVTFRDPKLADDPRFKIYEKIEPYLREWGIGDVIPQSNIVYTALQPKAPIIYHLCQEKRIPFVKHYDDDMNHVQGVERHKGLQRIAVDYMDMAQWLPYRGVFPPKTAPLNTSGLNQIVKSPAGQPA